MEGRKTERGGGERVMRMEYMERIIRGVGKEGKKKRRDEKGK